MIKADDIVEIIVDRKDGESPVVYDGTFSGIPEEARPMVEREAVKSESFSGLPLLGEVDYYILHLSEVPSWII